MKEQFISKLLGSPWSVRRDQSRTLIGSMIARIRSERPEKDQWGDPLPHMEVVGDVAVIPVTGLLMIAVPDWLKEFGLSVTDANDVGEELDRAVHDPAVSLILLEVDSPGGWSVAGNKLYELVETANRRKPIAAFCADGAQICSAAYQCAAAALAIYSGRHTLATGSIGTYHAVLDDSEFWQAQGLKWEVFRSGELKGIGEDALTPEQREFLQISVDEYGARFRANVSRYRTAIAPEDMRGQWFSASEALRRGFIGSIAKDRAAAIAKLRALIG